MKRGDEAQERFIIVYKFLARHISCFPWGETDRQIAPTKPHNNSLFQEIRKRKKCRKTPNGNSQVTEGFFFFFSFCFLPVSQ